MDVSRTARFPINLALSSPVSSQNVGTGSLTTFVDITNLTVTIATSGRPVVVGIAPDPTSSTSFIQLFSQTTTVVQSQLQLQRDGVQLFNHSYSLYAGIASQSISVAGPPAFVDVIGAAGTYTYKIRGAGGSAGGGSGSGQYMQINGYRLYAYEL